MGHRLNLLDKEGRRPFWGGISNHIRYQTVYLPLFLAGFLFGGTHDMCLCILCKKKIILKKKQAKWDHLYVIQILLEPGRNSYAKLRVQSLRGNL